MDDPNQIWYPNGLLPRPHLLPGQSPAQGERREVGAVAQFRHFHQQQPGPGPYPTRLSLLKVKLPVRQLSMEHQQLLSLGQEEPIQ